MEVLGRLSALLVLLLAGTGLRATGVFDDVRTDRLNALAYYVALPALVLVSTYDLSVGELLSSALLAGLLIVLFATAAFAWVVHLNRSSRIRWSVAVVRFPHSNTDTCYRWAREARS